MKYDKKLFLAGLAAVGLTGIPASGHAQSADPPPPAVSADVAASDDLVQAIRGAQTPSAAVEAYARASKTAPGDLRAESVYVRRMIELGSPEMAESQAKDVASRDPKDGLASAVLAYSEAERDQYAAAVRDIGFAVRMSPDEVFVQRTAGQIVAWFDSRADQSQIAQESRDAIASMRQELADRTAYVESYRRAMSSYSTVGDDVAVESPPVTTTYGAITYVYTDPYLRYYDPWWHDSWYWGPTGVVFVDGGRFHHFRGDRGRFGRRDFDRGFEHRDFGRDGFRGNRAFVRPSPRRDFAPAPSRVFQRPPRIQSPGPRQFVPNSPRHRSR